MGKKFNHLILTRFNYGLYDSKRKDRSGNPVSTRDWMNHRVRMFELYTLPSILKQTNHNFKWIVQFDPKTPKEVYRKYEGFSNILISFSIFRNQVKLYQHENPSEFLITSRIDNDDAFCRGYIDYIQKEAVKAIKSGTHEIIFDTSGYQISGGKVYPLNMGRWASPFISFLEPASKEPKTVFFKQHDQIKNFLPYHKTEERLFIQVIHDRNLINSTTKIKPLSMSIQELINK